MERTLVKDLPSKEGQTVKLKGWQHHLRDLGKIAFLILRDRSGLVQIVIQSKEELRKVAELQPGTVLTVEGKVQKTEATDLGAELVDPKITVEVPIKEVPPVEYYKDEMKINLDTELEYRPIVLRNIKKQAIFKVQAGILEAFRKSMRSQDFTEFRNPILMGSPSESGADVFEAKYFDGKAYLAQSPQLYKQIMIGAFERVFTVTPVFRAEKHSTTRHIIELTQLDGEMAFIESYHDVMAVVEQVMRDIIEHLGKKCSKELALHKVELPKIPKQPIPKIKVKEALAIIEKRTGKSAKREELDVDPEDERELGKWALEEHNSDFLWLINFKKDKNFYTWNDPDNPDESLSYDLLFRGLELLSGTHRIHLYDKLVDNMEKQGLNKKYFNHFLQAFKYGMPSEGGFSFGLERLTQQVFQLKNIRQATLFPSDLKRIAGAKRMK